MIDSHVHLDDSRFDKDRDEIIKSLKENGLDLVINIGADLKTSKASVELADKYENVYAAVGTHPHSAREMNLRTIEIYRDYSSHEKVVAIGEIGLDFYYDNSPREDQRKWFIEQLKLARQVKLPVIIHSRDASQETFDILSNAQDGNLQGVLHCYSGSAEMAKEYIKKGFHISIAGPVTFNNARVLKEVAEAVPLDRLLIETDCPYLTPTPFRGKRNEPKYVKYVAQEIAQIKGISFEELVKATSANTRRLFSL